MKRDQRSDERCDCPDGGRVGGTVASISWKLEAGSWRLFGTILADGSLMLRRTIAVPLAAIFAVSSFFLLRRESPRASDEVVTDRVTLGHNVNAGSRRTADVTVQQTLVTAFPDPSVAVQSKGRRTDKLRRSAPLYTRAAQVTHQPQAAGSGPLIARAKRVFLGDGRHRPQPFPRANY